MEKKHLEVLIIAKFTIAAAAFSILSTLNKQNEEVSTRLSIFSGIFWILSGMVLFIFVLE